MCKKTQNKKNIIVNVKPKSTKPESTKPKSTKPKSTKPESTKPKSTKPESTKILPSTHDKNGKKLTEYQKFMAVGLRKFSGNKNLTQKDKMQQLSKHWKTLKHMPFIDKSSQLPNHLNYRFQ